MILDHVEPLELEDSRSDELFNVLNRLAELAEGLSWLAGQVASIEATVFARLEEERELFSRDKRFFLMGRNRQMSHVPHGLVTSAFHWYAGTACNYVRSVGWLVYGPDKNRLNAYMDRVMPEVVLWRNKVAAHFAFTDPRTTRGRPDNPADFAAVTLPIGFSNDGFMVGGMDVGLRRAGQHHQSRDGMAWSLTATHVTLTNRYWRQGVPTAQGGIKPTATDEFMAYTDLGTGDVDITVGLSGLDGAQ